MKSCMKPLLGLALAGLVPAVILTICNLAAAYWVAVRRGYPTHGQFPGWGEVLRAFLASVPGLLVVVIILGGILSGAFTATESASIAVAWALLITVFVYRSLTWSHFLKACAKACKTTGVVLERSAFYDDSQALRVRVEAQSYGCLA